VDKKLIEIASTVIKMSVEDTLKHVKAIPEIGAYYFWNPIRGGIAVIVAENGEKLGATSSVSYDTHLKAFIDGKRN